MAFSQYIVNHLMAILPPTKLYWAKTKLWKIAGVNLDSSVRIISSAKYWGEGRLSIGKGTFVGHEVVFLTSRSQILIGDEVDIGPRVSIINGTHEIDMTGSRTAGEGNSDDIKIENGVWIGANSTILSGVQIGQKSIIGAGSVVTNNIPDHVIAVGIPCRPIKKWQPKSKTWTLVDGY